MIKRKLKAYIKEFVLSKVSVEKKKFFEKIDSILDEIYPSERVLRNLTRILENDYYIQIYIENLDYLLTYFELILKASAFSNYLTDILVRNPEFLTRFLSTNELNIDFSFEQFSNELEQQISIFKSFEKKIEALKRFKRLHLLRIGLRDILRLCDLKQTMIEYSFLTRAILNKAFGLSFDRVYQQSSLKRIPDYALISLGKLGGNELNFSSDVDLICVYDNVEEKNSSAVLEFYDKVVKTFIEICTDASSGHPLYRIDFRLRPDGKYSPLARSLSYYQIYYETYGRDWERQMLLKMNFLSGSKVLYENFSKTLENFIYPRSHLIPPQVFIQRFRNIYQEKLNSESEENLNVKHFKGGIRDVEFSVQALQLIYGGNLKDVRTPNTLFAIKKLYENNLIDKKTYSNLTDAYEFLRRVENFIQLMDDRQLHTIPQDKDRLENLTKYLQLKNSSEMKEKLKEYRKVVTQFSNKVFGIKSSKSSVKKLKNIAVENREEFERKFNQVLQLINQKLELSLTNQEKNLESFENRLIKFLRKCESPENALNGLKKLLTNIQSYFQIKELVENEKLLQTLLEIFDKSIPLTQYLTFDKKTIDLLFSGSLMNYENYFLDSKFSEEEFIHFIHSLMFNLFIGRIKAEKIPDLISSYIDKFILSLVEINLKKFNLNENQFALIGLGSYGNHEMHFKSDIDLLFVFSNKTDEMIAEKFSLNLLSDIRDRLKLLDYFQVDSRLRPEGSISKLAWSIDEIKKYINTRMRVWEFQSYTKMRLITGSKFIYDELTNSLNQRLKNLDEKFIAVEIKKNRLNIKSQKISSLSSSLDIKNSNGGLMDLQFFIHHKILRHNFKEQTIGRNFVDALSLLSKKDETLKKYKTTLSKNYQKLFKLILILQVLTGKRGFVLEKNFDSKFVKKYLKIPERINGFEYFEQILKENSFILKKLNPEIFE